MCDKAYIGPLVTTVYFCGVMLGGVIFGGKREVKIKWSEQENEIGFLEIRMTQSKTKLCSI